jgi:hypothetical protein
MIKTLIKISVVIAVLGAAYTVYYWEAIKGQWKFEELCEKEGGSRFYGRVEKDVGWEVVVSENDEHAYKSPFYFGHVAFVRFKDEKGILRDVYLTAGKTQWKKGYDIRPADMNKQPKYRYTSEHIMLPSNYRMSRSNTNVIDIEKNKLLARRSSFAYEWRSPDESFLNAPTSVVCPVGRESDDFSYSIYKSGRMK